MHTHVARGVWAGRIGGLMMVAMLGLPASSLFAQGKETPSKSTPQAGLLLNDASACRGYTLLAPQNSTNTYLIDMQGRVVRMWKSDCTPGANACLLKNGHLLRAGMVRNPPFFGGGAGGRVQEFTWDGKLVWDFTYRTETQLPHHEVRHLPNGNVLLLVWDKKSSQEAIAAGRRPETIDKGGLLSCSVLEVKPTGKTTGSIAWAWHVWDHLNQDFDAKRAHYGNVADHPECIDLNFGDGVLAAMIAKPDELAKLRAIGYVGGTDRKPRNPQQDWLHINAVDYNADLDQIMLSVYEFSEIWIIDHSTTTAEAAGHTGGRHARGGDLLYRWGNPRAYRAGGVKDQQLFGQHNAHWIPHGLPGEGHVLVFNNGMRRRGGSYSSVDEIVLPVDASGHYAHTPGKAFGPDKPVWSYSAPKRYQFFAAFVSGAQRLPGGDTLICSGPDGTVFEVTPTKKTVWKYVNPIRGGGPPMGGFPFPFGAPQLGTLLPGFLQGALHFNDKQRKQLQGLEKEMGGKLTQLLTEKQRKQAHEPPKGFGEFPAPGELLSSAVQKRLKLTPDEKKQLEALQKDADGKLDTMLDKAQKKQLQDMKSMSRNFMRGMPPPGPFAGGFPGGPPPGGRGGPPPGGRGGPPRGARGGPPGGPGFAFGPPGGMPGLFRAPRYTPDYPGLVGKDLTPGKTVEEMEREHSARLMNSASAR